MISSRPFTARVNNMEKCNTALTVKSVDEILWCDHSNETSLQQYFCLVPFVLQHVIKLNLGFFLNFLLLKCWTKLVEFFSSLMGHEWVKLVKLQRNELWKRRNRRCYLRNAFLPGPRSDNLPGSFS